MYMLINNVCLNRQNVPCGRVYILSHRNIEATVHSDYLKGGEQWISLTCFSTLKFLVSETTRNSLRDCKVNFSWGACPQTPYF